MNIFVTDICPKQSAINLCDKHVVKMTLESAQMLCTAQHLMASNPSDLLYKPTHENHPCNVWTRLSSCNYHWLFKHFQHLATEYTFRFGKVHASWKK